MFTFNWRHQSRLALPRVVCMTGHLPALSSVFASMCPSDRAPVSFLERELECSASKGQIGFAYDRDNGHLFIERRAQELADLQHGRFRLLFLRHVPTLVDDAEIGIRHLACELDAD